MIKIVMHALYCARRSWRTSWPLHAANIAVAAEAARLVAAVGPYLLQKIYCSQLLLVQRINRCNSRFRKQFDDTGPAVVSTVSCHATRRPSQPDSCTKKPIYAISPGLRACNVRCHKAFRNSGCANKSPSTHHIVIEIAATAGYAPKCLLPRCKARQYIELITPYATAWAGIAPPASHQH